MNTFTTIPSGQTPELTQARETSASQTTKGTENLFSLFYFFCLELAKNERTSSTQIMEDIREEQEIIATAKEMQRVAQEAIETIDDKTNTHTSFYDRTAFVAFRKKHNILYEKEKTPANTKKEPISSVLYAKEDWQNNIKTLESFITEKSSSLNVKMTRLEEHMGKYNAFLAGATKMMSDGLQVTKGLSSHF